MGVEGGGAVPVVDDHEVAVGPVGAGAILRHNDLSAPGRVDGDAGGGGHVNAGVAVWHVIHRVHPVAEGRGQLQIGRRQGPQPAVAGRRELDVVLLPLLLQLLLLPGDVRPDGGPLRVLCVQLPVDLRHIGVDLVQQLLGLRHLGLLLRPLGLLLLPGRLLLRAGALQLRLKPLQLLPGRGQLLHDLVVVVHHRVHIGQTVQQVGEVLGVKEDGPVGHRPLLLHGAHPLAEPLILGLLFGLRLPALRLFPGDLPVIVGDLRVDAVQLGIDCL